MKPTPRTSLAFLCWTAVLVFLLFVNPTGVRAAEETRTSGDWSYQLNGENAVITDYRGRDKEISIPETLDGYAVTGMTDNALAWSASVQSLTVGGHIAQIPAGAFYYCSNLKTVTLMPGVVSLGANAFQGCGKMNEISLCEGLVSIGSGAFFGCGRLESLVIPQSVTEMGDNPFADCGSLEAVTLAGNNTAFRVENGLLLTADNRRLIGVPGGMKEKTCAVPEGVETLGAYAFAGYKRMTAISLPATLGEVGDLCFMNCARLSDITIPDSVTRVGLNPFIGCGKLEAVGVSKAQPALRFDNGALLTKDGTCLIGLTQGYREDEYTVPDGVTVIGDYAFQDMTSLKHVALPESLDRIGAHAFQRCEALAQLTLPDRVTHLGDYAFDGCVRLKQVVLGTGLAEIGACAFTGCDSLLEITLSGSLSVIGYRAFDDLVSGITLQVDRGTYAERYAIASGIGYAYGSVKR